MLNNRQTYSAVILAGDIGGTNINLALVGKTGGVFSILFDRHYKTQEESSLLAPLTRFLDETQQKLPGVKPEMCCISAAGPVIDESIRLTNAPWSIKAKELQEALGIRTRLINDFTAISYGILLLDMEDTQQLCVLPASAKNLSLQSTTASDGLSSANIKLVVGAGTGLGVGYILKIRDRLHALSSEGGHIGLPVFDAESSDFQQWLTARDGKIPGAESAVSGRGIRNILSFLSQRYTTSPQVEHILRSPLNLGPGLVSEYAQADCENYDSLCAKAMEMFIRFYARVVADLTAVLLPKAVYLAGGIAAKNESLFVGNNLFRMEYEKSYMPHIHSILARTPVMIVKDYSISLYGAANAAVEIE